MTGRSFFDCFPSFSLSFAPALLAACAADPPPLQADGGPSDAAHSDGNDAQGARRDTGQTAQVIDLEGVLVDDFEDGDGHTTYPGGGWYAYDDRPGGGGSTIAYTGGSDGVAVMSGPGYASSLSLEVSYAFDQGSLAYEPYVGWGASLGDASAPLDISPYVGIGYTYRGSAHRVRIETFEVTNYDYFGMAVAESGDWRTVVVPFARLGQQGWGAEVAFNPQNVGNISFEARGATGEAGLVNIDNLMLLSRLPEQPPDMTVATPQPPADEPISSITITHPGQAKARAYLTRGYNITNWLEEARFAGFAYDEAYVAKLAAAGFKSLRLPVDLDRYVTSSTITGEVADVVVHEDLFTVLDAFVAWTAGYGMSLTIDYHQYDKSLDKAKPETIAVAVAVWGKVAARYAAHPREDLFYELLNEPELSMDGAPPTQDEWTAIAERMIAAIRKSDSTHTILFGDVQWYGIGPLSNRQPLSDGNVIYVFHDYEPFVFTHQGASWAGMASTHDLPYPYAAERWSPYFGDLGFSTAMDAWILSAAKDYYRTGNRSFVRNQVVQVKRWAVANNVPVMCNEFGAYDRTSRLEDRARYLADVISIFEELDIPWQQWFMIMDTDGNVPPEYRAALDLGS
ncbi:MAG: cellulase family glycosylhydrolase [Deltaproteobacteria bacterium]|nr:cellulase family glycosylhydrolase [Deltaproteobacteria bacterium]